MTREQRPSLLGGIVAAAALALLVWRAMANVASGSDDRAVSVGTPVPGLAADDRRYALIVAVGRYDDPSLPSLEGPSHDAEELHAALMAHAGFPPANVRRVDGSGPESMAPTRSNVLRALHELLSQIPDDGDATVLLAFSGRGTTDHGRAYLMPKDAVLGGGGALLASTSIDFDTEIRRRLAARHLKQVVVLMDSTLTAPGASPAVLTREFMRAVRIDARPPLEAVAFVHATGEGSSSYVDPAAGRSIFSQAVVDGLRGEAGRTGDGWVTLGSLLRYVEHTVPARARAVSPRLVQEPAIATSGFPPGEIRFARTAPRTASSSGELRCALRAPEPASGGMYAFDVDAGPQASATVNELHVVSGGVLGSPFGRPVALRGPRAWPIRRTSADRPLLAIARTSIGQCAAYAEGSARAPVYRVEWRAANADGVPYKEVFQHPTENRHGRTDVVAAGMDALRDREGRITRVEYSCEGATCGWSYHPDAAKGYAADVTVAAPPNGFTWRRRWDGEPALDVYTAFYEMPVRVCVEGCP